jgi:hypothetical protein
MTHPRVDNLLLPDGVEEWESFFRLEGSPSKLRMRIELVASLGAGQDSLNTLCNKLLSLESGKSPCDAFWAASADKVTVALW